MVVHGNHEKAWISDIHMYPDVNVKGDELPALPSVYTLPVPNSKVDLDATIFPVS